MNHRTTAGVLLAVVLAAVAGCQDYTTAASPSAPAATAPSAAAAAELVTLHGSTSSDGVTMSVTATPGTPDDYGNVTYNATVEFRNTTKEPVDVSAGFEVQTADGYGGGVGAVDASDIRAGGTATESTTVTFSDATGQSTHLADLHVYVEPTIAGDTAPATSSGSSSGSSRPHLHVCAGTRHIHLCS